MNLVLIMRFSVNDGIGAVCAECHVLKANYGFNYCKSRYLLGWCKSGGESYTNIIKASVPWASGFHGPTTTHCFEATDGWDCLQVTQVFLNPSLWEESGFLEAEKPRGDSREDVKFSGIAASTVESMKVQILYKVVNGLSAVFISGLTSWNIQLVLIEVPRDLPRPGWFYQILFVCYDVFYIIRQFCILTIMFEGLYPISLKPRPISMVSLHAMSLGVAASMWKAVIIRRATKSQSATILSPVAFVETTYRANGATFHIAYGCGPVSSFIPRTRLFSSQVSSLITPSLRSSISRVLILLSLRRSSIAFVVWILVLSLLIVVSFVFGVSCILMPRV